MSLNDKLDSTDVTKRKALLINQTEISQPAILLHSYLTFQKTKEFLINNYDIKYLFGPSLGEIIALVVGKSINLYDAGELLYKRGKYMQESCPIGVG